LFKIIFRQEGLRGIYDLFIDKIQSSISQIVDKLKLNAKFTNAFSYFNKDFVFFYFVVKLYSINLGIHSVNGLNELKVSFLQKFSSSVAENFNRAFSLVKSVEKTADTNGRFERENIVNVQIIDHFVKYIKFMSMSFIDLNEEFLNNSENKEYEVEKIENKLFKNDTLLLEIQQIFSGLLVENYFSPIFSKLENVFSLLSDANSVNMPNPNLQVQKFYFYYYILYKMNEVFISFLSSNIPYLISDNLQITIQNKLNHFMNYFYKAFLNRIMKDVKIMLINKDTSNL
jgi:hypothetical protein